MKRNRKLSTTEENFTQTDFLKEIYFLLKSEYIAMFFCDGEKITIEFLNGQKFEISVKEVS